jgi:serine phosphatase RsbU (regulator of sigma subunit)
MRHLLTTLLLLSTTALPAQINVDSLLSIWQDETQPDTIRLNAMNSIVWDNYLFHNPDSGFYFAQQQLDLATAKNEGFYEAEALNAQGVSWAMRGDLDTAIFFFTRSGAAYKKVDYMPGYGSIQSNLGNVYRSKGNNTMALNYYASSLSIQSRLENPKGMASAWNNLGLVYWDHGELEKAINNFRSARKTNGEIGNKRGIATCLGNIGNIQMELEQYDSALVFLDSALLFYEQLEDNRGISRVAKNIGKVHFSKGDLDLSMQQYQKSLELDIELENNEGISGCYNGIGEVYLKQGNLNAAITANDTALQIALRTGTTIKIRDAANSLYRCYRKAGNKSEALEMHELYIATRDSILTEESNNAVLEQEYKYQYEQKAFSDSIVDAQEEAFTEMTHKEDIKRSRIVIWASIAGLILLSLLAVVLIKRNREKQRANEVITEQHLHLEEKNREILDSIQYARRLQNAMLPPKQLVKEWLPDSFSLYKPKDIIAGDFYWLEVIDSVVYFAAADCTGHGVPGAMVSVVCSTALNKALLEEGLREPALILNRTREVVIEHFQKGEDQVKDGMDISLCALNTKNNAMQWAGAYNPLWIVRSETKEVEVVNGDRQPVAGWAELNPFTNHQLELSKGDTVYLFSDGYSDQFGGANGKKLKSRKFMELLLSIQDRPMSEHRQILDEAFEKWRGDMEQIDDVCVIGVRV